MRLWLVPILAALLGPAHAAETGDAPDSSETLSPGTVLLSRGEAEITVRDFQAALLQIPDEYRRQAANDPGVANKLLSQLLENRLLAAESEKSGVADQPMTVAAVRAATEKVLAQRQLAQVVEREAGVALESMARDYYRAHPEEFRKPPLLTVRHVLVGTEDRSDQAALDRAIRVRKQAAEGADFEKLVAEYSDDTASAPDGGLYEAVPADELVGPFADAAKALEPGAISEPVKTPYGYHVIKLIEKEERGLKPFEQVRSALVDKFAKQQRKRVRETYIQKLLDANPLEINEEAIEALTERFDAPMGDEPKD